MSPEIFIVVNKKKEKERKKRGVLTNDLILSSPFGVSKNLKVCF